MIETLSEDQQFLSSILEGIPDIYVKPCAAPDVIAIFSKNPTLAVVTQAPGNQRCISVLELHSDAKVQIWANFSVGNNRKPSIHRIDLQAPSSFKKIRRLIERCKKEKEDSYVKALPSL